jgi:hypothetical protein
MQPRILSASILIMTCSLSAPLARAHVGEHAPSGPVESFVHLLTGTGHWLAVPLLLLGALALVHLLKVRTRN